MPSRSRSTSSSEDSSKPNTAVLSGWNSLLPCDHERSLVATKMKILAHQMLTWEPSERFRHHAVKVAFKCTVCKKNTWKCYQFSSHGKSDLYGLYRSHKGMIRQMDVSIGFIAIQDIYKQMPGTGYNLATFNCQHWSNAFFEKVEEASMKGVRDCACSGEGVNVISMVHNEFGNKNVCVASIRCTCQTIFHISYEMSKYGKRKNNGESTRDMSCLRIIVMNMPLRLIEEAFSKMPSEYSLVRMNEKKWAEMFMNEVAKLTK